MTGKRHPREVRNASEFVEAAKDIGVAEILIVEDIEGLSSVRLLPGQRLRGAGPRAIRFAAGQDGIELVRDNAITDLRVTCDVDRRAVFNDTSVAALGRLELRHLEVTGVVRIVAADAVRSGHVDVEDVGILAADAREHGPRPRDYGVEVVAGAFTLWNQQEDSSVVITADIVGLSAGRAGAPVRGSGVFVSGAGTTGGRLVAARLETGEVHSDGGIAPGTADRIAAGVFTVYGAYVQSVCNRGSVTTYGPNDMVLDNWGTVDRWVAVGKITSFGPSAIGFVNFGTIGSLEAQAPIETFGEGARGFNVYAGTVHAAVFDRVVTHADGAVGIQISQPIGDLGVRRGIETFGGVGSSLVKGVVIQLAAVALSIKPGGTARSIEIEGGLITNGAGSLPLELNGKLDSISIAGGFGANGTKFAGI